jgi:MFS family permease
MTLLRNPRIRLAIASNGAGQGNMSIVMVLTSLVLAHHGHSLGAIALSQMFHSLGMFAFTIPLGKLADRFGRERVMYPGVATALIGAVLVTFAPTFETITLGTFLVGLGWAAANVAATALIADHFETAERGRAIGVNDSFAGGVTIATALATGSLAQWGGLAAAGVAAVLIALVPLLIWVFHRTDKRV